MKKPALTIPFGMIALLASVPLLLAQSRTAEQIAAAVPALVTDVHSGGGWQDGAERGIYRAVVVPTPGDGSAQVFVQWIAVKQDGAEPIVFKSVAIKEIAAKKLPNAFLTLEADKEGEITIVVASFDPATSKDTILAFKATKPGNYLPTKAPEGQPAGAPPKQ